MRIIATMVGRELGAYFLSPIAYVFGAIFLFTTGMAFALGTFTPGAESSLRSLFDPWILMILGFVLPMLAMRLVSEEYRGGTIETLMTAPVTETQVILGKFFGALVFYLIMLTSLLLFPMILRAYGQLDVGLLASNYLGLILLGSLYLAVGLFFSASTRHQIIAVLVSFAVLALLTFAAHALAEEVESSWFRTLLQQSSVRSHFHPFVRGMVEVNHLVFFLSSTAAFLFFAVKKLEAQRWQ